ncbi:MAG: ATP-binding cassette domain-containing protein [Polyangiaceae bacterium]|nr:ATP-binding cassette domain-containing protein [Polyangiaceae bacterium]
MIEYRDIHKAFDVPVLTGVSLVVQTGEAVALVGPSGAGKSILLKTTNGLILPDRGDVLIDGRSVLAASRRELEEIRGKIGYVFQNAALFDSLSIHDNVAQGVREEEARAVGQAEVTRRVVAALSEVNLDPPAVIDKLPSELSGGMRKRVGLARAIVGRPEILLYDEPVSGLDPVNAAAVSHLIERIARRLRVTSILVTHDVEGALEISDRVALLSGGVIRFVGTPEEFRRSQDPLVRAFGDRRIAAITPLNVMEGAS